VSAGRVLVRADAGAVGFGHAMRCLALVQPLTDEGGHATFLMADPPVAFAARAQPDGVSVLALDAEPGSPEDVAETVSRARELGADWTIIDSYDFDGGYQRALVAAGLSVLAFDDHGHAGRYEAQLVLNQNLGADPALYRDCAAHTRLLLGASYVLLRREFRSWPVAPRAVAPTARRFLVTLGASDPDDVSSRVLSALSALPGPLAIHVLVGAANLHRASLERAAAASPHDVELAFDVRDMPAQMAWADLAVSSASGTMWELARVGTPVVAVVLADNQRPAGRALADTGLAVSLGWHADLSDGDIAAAVGGLADDGERRAELERRGRELIDGQGALRVLAAMGLTREGAAAA
jgi:UDP-2,4-diacetamido-2,4,6-trideoxy-beta-L-altropyranose hydrolase